MTTEIRRARTAFIWVALVAPLVILALAATIIAAWMPDLPDPMAIHWSGSGADGFASSWAYVAGIVGIGAAVVVFDAVLALVAHRLPRSSGAAPAGPWSATARFLGAVNLGVGVMIAVIAVAGAAIQRGLTDAADAPDIGGWAAIGMVLLVVAAVLGWFLQPRSPVAPADQGSPAEALPLAANERAAWFGTATMARSRLVVLGAALAVLVLLTIAFVAGGDDAWWVLAALTALMAVLIGTMVVFRVRVDRDGLRARSLFGWPSNRIPLDRIAKVEVVELDPFREFGGWGWRLGLDGRRGIVLRRGEALQVTQSNGRVFVVTVDGASAAAAVLETLRARSARGDA